jgi:hypothetical protein
MSKPVEQQWADLENSLLTKYSGRYTPSFGYVFQNNNGQKGIRVEAPAIMVEFTDSVQLGRDPAGKLYYKALQPDFVKDGKYREDINAKVSYQEFKSGQSRLIVLRINFHHGSNEKPFSEFIARVPERAYINMDDQQLNKFKQPFEKQGKFKLLNVSQTTALLESDSSDRNVYITMNSLEQRKFKFDIPQSFTGDDAIYSWGYFIFREIEKLKKGVTYYVRYTSTGIVILEKDSSVDPVAVFGSYEIQTNTQPFPAELTARGSFV